MKWWTKTRQFLRDNWRKIAAALSVLFLIIGGIAYSRNSDKSKVQGHKIKVLKAKTEVARLEGRRDIIREYEDATEDEIAEIDKEIRKLDGVIKSSRADVELLSAKEKLAKFKKLGYGGEE